MGRKSYITCTFFDSIMHELQSLNIEQKQTVDNTADRIAELEKNTNLINHMVNSKNVDCYSKSSKRRNL